MTPAADPIPRLNAADHLQQAILSLGIDLAPLVARAALWVHPSVITTLGAEFPGGLWFPGTRRARLPLGEMRGRVIDGIRLDDNTYPNNAIKQAIFADARAGCEGFATCHVWPLTCYDPACHSALANLVLLPAPLAGLSDHSPALARILQYRSYQLYGWLPPGLPVPERPANQPEDGLWPAPAPPPPQVLRRVEARLRLSPSRPL